jgi:S-formylglutathione hydrolase FrmB
MRAHLNFMVAGLLLLISCSPRGSRIVSANIRAPSLDHNELGIANHQHLVVYLPPSYDRSPRRFPVLYFLPNFNCCLWRYTGGSFQGFHLRQAMDRELAKGAAREMIIVIPNAVHFLGGSFYRNSPLTGNWEDFITRDVVNYIDKNFRTIPAPTGRGIAGHGVGGTGALEIALKHPETFGCVYAMSPALFDSNGLRDSGMLSEDQLRKWQGNLERWQPMDTTSRRRSFRDFIQTHLNSPARSRFLEGLFVSYGAAMAADIHLPFPHIAFPAPGKRPDPTLVAQFENGFGAWPEKIACYLAGQRRLRRITIEYGKDDEYPWIRRGASYVSGLLDSQGVTNTLELSAGGHESDLGRRLETGLLPAISRQLRPNDE